jgi:hypothetical protein
MGITTLQTMLTTIHINYFLYHMRSTTQVGKKIEISLAHMQIEVGACQQVFTASFETHSHLATRSMVKCLWGEMEPFGLYIRGDVTQIWTPSLQGNNDVTTTKFVAHYFNITE